MPYSFQQKETHSPIKKAIQTDIEQCVSEKMNTLTPKPIDIQTMYKVILDVLAPTEILSK